MQKPNIGLIGIIGKEATEEFWPTTQRVAQTGYRGMESPEALLSGNVPENLKRFHDLPLQVLTVSTKVQQLREDLPGLITKCRDLQSPRASVWWQACDTREAVLKDAELFNTAGAILWREGIKLTYHHHDHEFKNVFDGSTAFDLLVANTDAAHVFFYVDIAWAAFAKVDPAALIRKLRGRVPAIHAKDLTSIETRGQWTTIGTGIVNTRECLTAAVETGVEWIVVEQDTLRNLSAWETVTASYLNLKEMGFAP